MSIQNITIGMVKSSLEEQKTLSDAIAKKLDRSSFYQTMEEERQKRELEEAYRKKAAEMERSLRSDAEAERRLIMGATSISPRSYYDYTTGASMPSITSSQRYEVLDHAAQDLNLHKLAASIDGGIEARVRLTPHRMTSGGIITTELRNPDGTLLIALSPPQFVQTWLDLAGDRKCLGVQAGWTVNYMTTRGAPDMAALRDQAMRVVEPVLHKWAEHLLRCAAVEVEPASFAKIAADEFAAQKQRSSDLRTKISQRLDNYGEPIVQLAPKPQPARVEGQGDW